jgi:peptide/nickel transport system substrate-binding protein
MERVIFRFIEDSTVQVQALRGGEIDILSSQAQLDLVEQVNKLDEVTPGVVSGGVWEFFELNHSVPGLDQPFVRQAIAMGINREELTGALIGQMQPDAEPLQSLVYVNDQEEYVPAFDRWEYDPEGARALLEENGCSAGSDGIYVCDGTRLSFSYGYTAGNELRELQFVVIQYYLKQVGIELRPAAEDAATFFGDTWPAGEWELFNQAWLNTADPNPSLAFWECEGELNYRSYCNEQVDRLVGESRTELDPQRRADLLNEANEIMAQDLPALPLYQKPTFLAWDSVVSGPQPNPTDWGHLWNIEEWAVR